MKGDLRGDGELRGLVLRLIELKDLAATDYRLLSTSCNT